MQHVLVDVQPVVLVWEDQAVRGWKVEDLEVMIIKVTEGPASDQGDEENDFEMKITCS